MSETKLSSVIVYEADGDLPAGAAEVFGREVEPAWSAARAARDPGAQRDPGAGASDGGGVIAPTPICLCILDEEDRIAAGVFMLMEEDDSPESEHDGRGATGAARGAPPASPDSSRHHGVASIRQLVVLPEHRGRSLAGRLIRAAMEAGRMSGCTRIRSTAGWGCPDHLFMYERLNFRRASGGDRPYLVTRSLNDSPRV